MNEQAKHEVEPKDSINWPLLSWWLMLSTAVLAIPALGFVIVTVTGIKGIMGICVFAVCCWVSTYFGMYLVRHPNMHKKIDFTK